MFDDEDDPPPSSASKRERRDMSTLAAIGVAFGSYFVFVWLATMTTTGGELPIRDLASAFTCQVIALLLGLFFVLRIYGPDDSIREFVGLRRSSTTLNLIGLLLGLALVMPVNMLFDAIVDRFPGETGVERLSTALTEASTFERITVALTIALFGPILEELFYRGGFFRPLLRRQSPLYVITLTSLLFAVAHDMRAVLPILIVGMAIGLLRWQSGSVVPGVLLHISFNTVPMIELLWFPDLDSTQLSNIWLILSAAAAVALILWAFQVGANDPDAISARRSDTA